MKINIQDGLPFVTAALTYNQRTITLQTVVLDTGSAGTILSIDRIDALDLVPEPDDAIYQVIGVGGSEYVFSKRVDALALGDIRLRDFVVEFGAMHYGVHLDGIIGLDFLIQTRAIIDLTQLEVYQSRGDGHVCSVLALTPSFRRTHESNHRL